MGKTKTREIDEIQDLFSRIIRSMRRFPTRKPLAANITFAQMRVLWFLESRSQSTMGELAEMLSVTRPTATSIVNRLVSRGFISRERCKKDRRVVKLELLRKGASVLAARRKHFRNRIAEMLHPLSKNQRRKFAAALRIVSSTVENSSAQHGDRR